MFLNKVEVSMHCYVAVMCLHPPLGFSAVGMREHHHLVDLSVSSVSNHY